MLRILLSVCVALAAASLDWVWWAGMSTPNTASSVKMGPGARQYAGMTLMNRTTMFVVGGRDEDTVFGDIWRLDIAADWSNKWRLVGGTLNATVKGNIGKKKKAYPATERYFGARTAMHLIPTTDAFYVYGGYVRNDVPNDSTNDVWRFDVAKETLTWLHGTRTSQLDKVPPSRQYACLADTGDEAYLYGGIRDAGMRIVALADLWRFNKATGEFKFAGGVLDTNVNPTVKGHIHPGSRFDHQCFYDKARRAILIVGGKRVDEAPRNDMYAFSLAHHKFSVIGTQFRDGDNVLPLPTKHAFTKAYWTVTDATDREFHLTMTDCFVSVLDAVNGVIHRVNVTALSFAKKQSLSVNASPGLRVGAAVAADRTGTAYLFGGSINGTMYGDLWAPLSCSTGVRDPVMPGFPMTCSPHQTALQAVEGKLAFSPTAKEAPIPRTKVPAKTKPPAKTKAPASGNATASHPTNKFPYSNNHGNTGTAIVLGCIVAGLAVMGAALLWAKSQQKKRGYAHIQGHESLLG